MSSSEARETLEPEYSSSLETMLGCLNEVGRETAFTPSSSSGAQALSSPTLDSSESSVPATPPVERDRAPPNPWPEPGGRQDGAEESPAALNSHEAAFGHASAGQLPQHSTGGLLPVPAGGGAPALGQLPAGPVNQTTDTVMLLIRQMQQQQEMQQQQMMQQQEMLQRMLQNLNLQSLPTVAPPPHLPPPQPRGGRPGIEGCPQCERQEPHECPHSERGGSLAGSLRRAEVVASPPGQRATPVAQHLQCSVSRWVNHEGEAAGGPPHYAESVGSSVNQRVELSIELSTRKLQKSIKKMKLTEGGGEKGISHTALLHSALQETYPTAVRLGQESPTL